MRRHDVSELVLPPKSKIAQLLTQMWEGLGDRIAWQYAGSEAHKKVSGQAAAQSNRKKKNSKTSEVLTSIRRYYSNSFTDRPKQDAMNVFLGIYRPWDVFHSDSSAFPDSSTCDDEGKGGEPVGLH